MSVFMDDSELRDFEAWQASCQAAALAHYEAQCALLTDAQRDLELQIMADHMLHDADCELELELELLGLELFSLDAGEDGCCDAR